MKASSSAKPAKLGRSDEAAGSSGDPPEILVVDDDKANLIAIEAALGDLGPRLVTAASGAEALRHLVEGDFAVIILDVQMPSMDGFETARLIRSRPRTQHIPIIFVTAYSRDDVDILRGYGLGAVDFLFKPIVPEVLRAKVGVFVELRRRTAQVARQAEMLREHESREHQRRLAIERQSWEAKTLRRQVEQERRAAAELARKAEELENAVRELERAERELVRINRRLEETDRRKDEFLALLAHELRNPLAPIVNSVELIRLRHARDRKLLETCDLMERQVGHLRRLMDDLLDVSRINSGKIGLQPTEIVLDRVIEMAISASSAAIEAAGHTLEVQCDQRGVVLQADALRMTQIVANLLNNAARYTDPGGTIRVRYGTDGDEVVVVVEDNGRGIREDMIERVFEIFVQERAGNGGLGLGLTLVKRLVDLHGGTVTASSKGAGQGSRFEVRLPRGLPSPERASTVDVADEQITPLRIVVIEDNPDVRHTVSALLETWGHRVDAAENGRRGVDLVLSKKPDVVLVDIGLPDVTGYDVARELRTARWETPPRLVAVTGYGQHRDRQRALESGFDEHLVKPPSLDALRRALVPLR